MNVQRSEVKFGSYNVIMATVENKKDFYITKTLDLIKSIEVEIVNGRKKHVILPPNSKKRIFWIAKVNEDLNKGSIYTLPLEVYSDGKTYASATFSSSSDYYPYSYSDALDMVNLLKETENKEYSKDINLQCSVPEYTYFNKTFDVKCLVQNNGNVFLDDVSICLEEKCERFDLGISRTKELFLDTRLEKKGEQELKIEVKDREINAVDVVRVVIDDMPRVIIAGLDYPENTDYENFAMRFEVQKKSISKPVDVSVLLTFNDRESEWYFTELNSKQVFNVDIAKSMLNLKNNKFSIEVIYHDLNKKEFRDYVEKEIQLNEATAVTKVEIGVNSVSRKISDFFIKIFEIITDFFK